MSRVNTEKQGYVLAYKVDAFFKDKGIKSSLRLVKVVTKNYRNTPVTKSGRRYPWMNDNQNQRYGLLSKVSFC